MAIRDFSKISLRNTIIMVLLCTVFGLPFPSSVAYAHSVRFQYFTCRVCGNTFIGAVSMSGYTSGVQLDFKQTGAIPQPWPVEQCPQCNFIVKYDKVKPNGNPYAENEFADLMRYILSDEYQNLEQETSPYGCVVKIAENTGDMPDFAMANLYRAAFWETERPGQSENPLATGYLQKMLMYFEKCARTDTPDLDDKLVAHYMQVEVNRRLGRFNTAELCRKEVLLLLDSIKGEELGEKSKRLFDTIKLFSEQQQQYIAREDSGAQKAVFPGRN